MRLQLDQSLSQFSVAGGRVMFAELRDAPARAVEMCVVDLIRPDATELPGAADAWPSTTACMEAALEADPDLLFPRLILAETFIESNPDEAARLAHEVVVYGPAEGELVGWARELLRKLDELAGS
jgi:hypothetical protein